MNRIFTLLFFYFIACAAYAQFTTKPEAWDNYKTSVYEEISNNTESDATILFDRTYFQVAKTNYDKVELLTTIHRKIKINSLNGLEQFNKLYIPTYNDLHYTLEMIDCKAKTLKKGENDIITNISELVTTTLPANTPFYYKVKGEVKMLALNDINVGDEIEYIYSVKHSYDIPSEFFYKTDRVVYSSKNYCLEKSLFFNNNNTFNMKLWPHNFHNGITANTDFEYQSWKKVSLTHIPTQSDELYSLASLDEPYLNYIISSETNAKDDTWEDFTKNFKPRRHETKHSSIFNGESILEALSTLEDISSKHSRFQAILNKINKPLQEHFSQYDDIKNNINISWTYAKIISKTLKKLHMPVNLHFVVSKQYGKLDKSYVTLYQFDNIIASFTGKYGKTYYIPILEPYSKFNDIRAEFQNTECFTIKQDEKGVRTYEFGRIPRFNEDSRFSKHVDVTLVNETSDTLFLAIKEHLKYTGNTWTDIKPYIKHMLNKKEDNLDLLKQFIENQIVSFEHIDSIQNIVFNSTDSNFTLNYQYNISHEIRKSSSIIELNPNQFIQNNFYTPYHLRNNRTRNGYLFDEYNKDFKLSFNLGNRYTWIEHSLIAQAKNNEIGNVKCTYFINNNGVSMHLASDIKEEQFSKNEWHKIMELRDLSYNFLNTNLYFKKQ